MGYRVFETLSLRARIVLTICGIVVISSLIMTVVFVSKSEELTEAIATKEIETQAELLSSRVKNSLNTIATELASLSHLPSIRVVAAANAGAGTDGAPIVLPAAQIEQIQGIFAAIMEDRPHYTQIRLLALGHGGHELVRNTRTAGGIEAVPVERLQEKAGEPYFREAVSFFDVPEKSVHVTSHEAHYSYLSEITLNRENGVVSEPKTATLRFIEPIYSPERALLGFLIINADYGQLLRESFRDLPIDHRVFVFNENLDYIEYDKASAVARFAFHQNVLGAVPDLLKEATTNIQSRYLVNDTDLAVQVRFDVNDDPSRYFGVLVQADRSRLLAGVADLNSFGFLVSLFLVAGAVLAAWAFADRLTKPLFALTESVVTARQSHESLDLTTTRSDELGMLAREFQGLYAQLADSELRSRLILSGVGDGIIAIRTDGTIISVNPALERTFGYDIGELVGENVSVLMPGSIAEKHDDYLQRYRDTQTRKIEWEKRQEIGRRKSGDTFPIELTVTEATLGDEALYIGILRDISERRAVEKAKSEFLAVISHELRTPLSSVMGAIRLLEKSVPQEPESQINALIRLADRNSKRLLELVEDILDFESYSSGVLRLKMDELTVKDLLADAADMVAIKAKRVGVSVTIDCPTKPVLITGDEKKLLQALTNLLNNAIKFSPSGQEVRLGARTNESGEGVIIWVEDKGIGIPESELERIFDSFAQVDSSDSRGAEGVGLGLSIAQKIVRLHEGTISVTSAIGEGTRFTIELPLRRLPEAAQVA